MSKQEKYAEKIAKLLRKAESTTPEEAELLMAKAQELMTEYAISEAMIDAARGISQDGIEEQEFVLSGGFRVALGQLTFYVLLNNGCKAVLGQNMPRMIDGKVRKQTYILFASGFKSDLERARALDASLQIQAVRAQASWWNANKDFYGDRDGFLARRQFLFSFASGANEKLMAATARGRAAAEKAEAERTKQSESDAKASVALVLVSRKTQVEKWFEDKYGGSLRSHKQRQTAGDAYAASAGREAGRMADVGQPGLSGSQKGIGR